MMHPKKSPHISIIRSDDEIKVFNAKEGVLFRITPIGARMLSMCNGKNNIHEILAIAKGIDKEKAKSFLDDLKEKGLIE